MFSAPLLEFATNPLAPTAEGDIVYLPIWHPTQGRLDGSKKFFYPIFSPRLPLQYTDYVVCLQELNDVLENDQLEYQKEVASATSGCAMCWGKLALLSVLCFMFLAFTTFSQLDCSKSPAAAVAMISIAMVFICGCNGVCVLCRLICSSWRRADQLARLDMFSDDAAPGIAKLQSKLAELGQRYRVTFDLLSSAHVVDKRHGCGRAHQKFITYEEAWQTKIAYDASQGVIAGPNTGILFPRLVHCVALRQKFPYGQDPPPPPPPPLWRLTAASEVVIADPPPTAASDVVVADPPPPLLRSTAASYVVVADRKGVHDPMWCLPASPNPTVVQCVETINSQMTRGCWKKIVLSLAGGILFMGGASLILSGEILRVLHIGCIPDIDHPGKSELPASLPFLPVWMAWIVYFGIVLAWILAVYQTLKMAHAGDRMGDLMDTVSRLNKQNMATGVEINIGMEMSMRPGKSPLEDVDLEMFIAPEPILYFTGRALQEV